MRVLIAHPFVHSAGGGNAVAAWALQALRSRCNLTLATLGPMDYAKVNESFGTSLGQGDFRVAIAPRSYRTALRWFPTPGALLECSLLARHARNLDRQERYDLLLGTQNEVDFGRRGLQYVHYPWMYLPRPDAEMRWFHKLPLTLRTYRRLCRWLARGTYDGLRRNLFLANSRFVAERIRQVYDAESVILYPPVPGVFPEVPWVERSFGLIAVGRIHGCKRWDMVVRIVDELRRYGHALSLTLAGHRDDPAHGAYLESLAASRPWFRLIYDLSRTELANLIAGHRYGIHTMENEHFGIAPAEMQRAGCITFVHNSGGPVEIVGGDERLTFSTVEDAVEKIGRVLADPSLESDLRAYVALQRGRFTTERFCSSLCEIVEQWSR